MFCSAGPRTSSRGIETLYLARTISARESIKVHIGIVGSLRGRTLELRKAVLMAVHGQWKTGFRRYWFEWSSLGFRRIIRLLRFYETPWGLGFFIRSAKARRRLGPPAPHRVRLGTLIAGAGSGHSGLPIDRRTGRLKRVVEHKDTLTLRSIEKAGG